MVFGSAMEISTFPHFHSFMMKSQCSYRIKEKETVNVILKK